MAHENAHGILSCTPEDAPGGGLAVLLFVKPAYSDLSLRQAEKGFLIDEDLYACFFRHAADEGEGGAEALLVVVSEYGKAPVSRPEGGGKPEEYLFSFAGLPVIPAQEQNIHIFSRKWRYHALRYSLFAVSRHVKIRKKAYAQSFYGGSERMSQKLRLPVGQII